jgi:hypothetical protein
VNAKDYAELSYNYLLCRDLRVTRRLVNSLLDVGQSLGHSAGGLLLLGISMAG